MRSVPGDAFHLPAIPHGVPPSLEKHIRAVKVLLGAYAVMLPLIWYMALNRKSLPSTTLMSIPIWTAAVVYCILVVECTIVQQGLFNARVGKHRGWQVVVGALILNPCFFGWWIPMSVLLAVGRARSR